LSGIWQVMNTAAWDIQDHNAQKGVPAGVGVVVGNEIPYKPEALAKKRENYANRATADPESKCYLPGVPRIMYMPYPFQSFRSRIQITMLFEYVHATPRLSTPTARSIPPGPLDWWMGDLARPLGRRHARRRRRPLQRSNVVRSRGNFHSEQLHLVERFTRSIAITYTYEVTVEDPKVFHGPVAHEHGACTATANRNSQILEYECFAFDNEFHARCPSN
jgi:hypothetical protein